jgi:phosphoribosylanthranilate isomerase
MFCMLRTRIQICGICRAVDAQAAGRAGADAIGLVFDPAAGRCVSVEQAKEIIAGVLPFVSIVGMFVDANAETIRRVAAEIPLAAVQLHGHESPGLVLELKPLRVIKVLRTDEADELALWRAAIGDWKLTNLLGIVMETPASAAGAPGGSGVINDWNRLSDLQKRGEFDGLGALIVAGGLTPTNVGDVVRLLRPFAVDVSSGVESGKREKSADKIAAFIRAVRAADEHLDS